MPMSLVDLWRVRWNESKTSIIYQYEFLFVTGFREAIVLSRRGGRSFEVINVKSTRLKFQHAVNFNLAIFYMAISNLKNTVKPPVNIDVSQTLKPVR